MRGGIKYTFLAKNCLLSHNEPNKNKKKKKEPIKVPGY
jgi:hypothetical protein